jgi:polyhydroxybutyrate depolymerase
MRSNIFILLVLFAYCFAANSVLGRSESVPVKAQSAKPGDYEDSLSIGQQKRSYLVHVPKKFNGERLPVVIVFHGGLANARMSQWNARMVEKGDSDNFFVVYPHGSSGVGKHLLTWNAGTCCGLAAKNDADDIGFVKAMIHKLLSDYAIDPSRVFVTGMSNGGMMAYRVACELPDLIAAAAPVEGCMLSKYGITGTTPVSIVAFNGTDDHVVKYDGGDGSFLGYKIHCPAVKDSLRLWAEHDHCDPIPKVEKLADVEKLTYRDGEGGAEVCLYTLEAGHTWPGGRSKMPFQKTTQSNFSATDAMCEFFWKHPKNPSAK